jgi:hypothetical protein
MRSRTMFFFVAYIFKVGDSTEAISESSVLITRTYGPYCPYARVVWSRTRTYGPYGRARRVMKTELKYDQNVLIGTTPGMVYTE